MDVHLLGPILIVLLIGCFVAILAQSAHIPYTIALVLVGVVVSLLDITPGLYISHDITFTLILPPLLFYGAMHMDLESLKNNWKSIGLLAVPGVLCSTFVIGFLIHKLLGIEPMYALLFGALITPTDPISVLGLLKQVGAPKRLRTIIEGESLFNDGTGVVIFAIVLSMIKDGGNFSLGASVLEFFKVGGGGTVIGLGLGAMAYQIFKRIDDHLVEVALTVVLTFGTPLVAEYFHFSGVIAVVVAGLVVGNKGKICSMSDKVRETLDTFWEVIDFLINSIIFIVIGLELQVVGANNLGKYVVPILITIAVVVVSRLAVVYTMVPLRNLISHNDIPRKWSHVLWWGGLKGSISLALVVGLPAGFMHRDLFLALTFSVVLFTLVVQGLTIKPLVRKLGIKANE